MDGEYMVEYEPDWRPIDYLPIIRDSGMQRIDRVNATYPYVVNRQHREFILDGSIALELGGGDAAFIHMMIDDMNTMVQIGFDTRPITDAAFRLYDEAANVEFGPTYTGYLEDIVNAGIKWRVSIDPNVTRYQITLMLENEDDVLMLRLCR